MVLRYTLFGQTTCHAISVMHILSCSLPECTAGYIVLLLPLYSADVDECTRGIDNCDVNAACVNTEGSFGFIMLLQVYWTAVVLSMQYLPDMMYIV